jgi:hypothetical protein
MPTLPQKSLLVKILAILAADATLTALVPSGRIKENLPDGTLYPHVRVVPPELEDWGSHTFDGVTGLVEIRVWDQAQSAANTLDILARIYALLHNIDLALTGFSTVNFRCTFTRTDLEPDGRTYQGIQRYSVTLGGN